jgi:hypothetical protein
MEKRLKGKTEAYFQDFKNSIHAKMTELGLLECPEVSELMKHVYEYPVIELGKEDFQKRKRVKNHVPHYQRCLAKRANGDQCTRRKKGDNTFCGTHEKGTPHGIFSNATDESVKMENIEVWVEEIKGISYYIDGNNNVYDHQDILSNNQKMSVIAKYELKDGVYTIPTLGI